MPGTHRRLRALVVAVAAAAVPAVAAADAAPPHEVISHYETSSGNTLERDCGFSHRQPGSSTMSVWLFCHTPIVTPTRSLAFIPRSTAADRPITPRQVPTRPSRV